MCFNALLRFISLDFLYLYISLDFLLMYLKHKQKTAEFRDKLAEINEKVEEEFGGSITFRDIETLVSESIEMACIILFLQRMAGSHFDTDGSVLIRYQTELPGATSSPFIVAVQVEK